MNTSLPKKIVCAGLSLVLVAELLGLIIVARKVRDELNTFGAVTSIWLIISGLLILAGMLVAFSYFIYWAKK